MFNWRSFFPASTYGMPEHPTRQWIIENAGWSHKVMMKTPDSADIPVPGHQGGGLFTHALYVLDCEHEPEEICNCSDDDSLEWDFVEFYNINELSQPIE